MRIRFLLPLLLTLLLVTFACAAAEDAGGDPLSWTELSLWAEGYREAALATEPLNDPTAEEALTDDGYAFVYPFATLFFDAPVLDESTHLNAVSIVSAQELAPHMTACGQMAWQVLEAYYQENAELEGTSQRAILFVADFLPYYARWGMVSRDGAELNAIQYSVHEQDDDASGLYTDAGIVYRLTGGEVAEIYAYGLSSHISYEQALATVNMAQQWQLESDGTQVDTVSAQESFFGLSDLTFSGLSFPDTLPEQAANVLTGYDDWIDENHDFLRMFTSDDAELTWSYQHSSEVPELLAIEIYGGGLTGPRGMRVGDSREAVQALFPSGEGEYDGTREMFYGEEGTAPYGMAEYAGNGEAVFRYACLLPDGREAVLMLSFFSDQLNSILLYAR